jgi:hypothetical protein
MLLLERIVVIAEYSCQTALQVGLGPNVEPPDAVINMIILARPPRPDLADCQAGHADQQRETENKPPDHGCLPMFSRARRLSKTWYTSTTSFISHIPPPDMKVQCEPRRLASGRMTSHRSGLSRASATSLRSRRPGAWVEVATTVAAKLAVNDPGVAVSPWNRAAAK